MRVRATGLGLFCLAMLFLGETSTFAAVNPIVTTPLQTQSVGPSVPNWGPTNNLPGSNPLVFSQFDPSLGQLQSINLTMTFNTSEVVKMTFVTASTITLKSSNSATPNQGAAVALMGPGSNSPLITDSAPVFTYTKTSGGGGQVFSNIQSTTSPGSPFFLTPDGQPNNIGSTFSNTKTLAITDAGGLALFTGTGTVGLPVFATAGSSFTNTSGNGSGFIMTLAGVTVSLSYTYVVPEPSSVALLGLGGAGILMAGRIRRRRRAAV